MTELHRRVLEYLADRLGEGTTGNALTAPVAEELGITEELLRPHIGALHRLGHLETGIGEHGDEIADVFTGYDDAIKAGYSRFGLEPFLVKQVQAIERPQFVSRFVDPCASTRPT